MITVNGKDSTYRSTFASSSSSRVFSQVGCHISISKYLTKKGLHLRWRRCRQHPSRCVVCGGDCGGGRRPRRRARRPLRGRGQHRLCYPLPTQCRFKIFATVTIVCSKQYAVLCTSILASLDLGWSATSVTLATAVSARPKTD